MHTKKDRACAIVSLFAARYASGQAVPGHGGGGTQSARRIVFNPRCHAIFSPGMRVTQAFHTPTLVGERYIPDSDWCLVEVFTGGRLSLVANVQGWEIDGDGNFRFAEVSPYHYIPGQWESWLGVDRGGDTVPLLPALFADPKLPSWQAFLASDDAKLPPLREGRVVPDVPAHKKRSRSRHLRW